MANHGIVEKHAQRQAIKGARYYLKFRTMHESFKAGFYAEMLGDDESKMAQMIRHIIKINNENVTIGKELEKQIPRNRKKKATEAVISLHSQGNEPIRIKRLLSKEYPEISYSAIRSAIYRHKNPGKRSHRSERS